MKTQIQTHPSLLLSSTLSHSPMETPPPPPTTFVQTDPHSFRDLVQKLTGATDDTPEKMPITVPSRLSGPRRSAFKLQERRRGIRKLEIKLGLTSLMNSPSQSPRFSPIPSPVTPLGSYTLFSGGHFSVSSSESPSPVVSKEEKAIAEKGFYLHPSPLSTPRGTELPELLPLFPLISPKQSKEDHY
ncbi:VQ motif-containing protein 31-like [Tasmannia lanceolata]|uniref:VQ motif-containing protein 31-like n=1 Tax=Tasmannia lanceolata TaxID=3420 RepID=UPI004062C955